ncbi:unnamed protein product [Rotaria magnacalcarata]|uniref:Uncharacterized protein n=1 Tax=Rotaria magnacalcarata TaxID=392030 RepID=A0A816M4Z9_9BILA|nr:unnamed protein product [Rotaria magnacalcarata]CAF3823958.1 unnamed protein product [Rotaria magnacalcarata]CAF5185550.1 unnamed protein product [Rotaria magnacalcarata]
MSSDEQNEEKKPRSIRYTEKIEEPVPAHSPPILYKPLKPRDLFEKYRDEITSKVYKVWPKVEKDFTLEPFQATFYYYDYGGQYTFICDLPDGRPTYITITESFEKEDEELANDETERRRRVIISVS